MHEKEGVKEPHKRLVIDVVVAIDNLSIRFDNEVGKVGAVFAVTDQLYIRGIDVVDTPPLALRGANRLIDALRSRRLKGLLGH
jgi:hypothetical protein